MGSQLRISEKELEKINKRANTSNCAWEKMANLGFTPKCLTNSRKRTKPGKGSKINKNHKNNNNKRHKQKHLDFNIMMEFRVL